MTSREYGLRALATRVRQSYKLRRIKGGMRLLLLRMALRGRFRLRETLAVAGSPRSGTTWLANLVSEIPGSAVLFEPLHLEYAPGSRRAGFSSRRYMPPNAKWPAGKEYLSRVFRGKVLNRWTTREASLREWLSSRRLVVKFIEANRLLTWMCEVFPEMPAPVFVIRHPCATIASLLKAGEWSPWMLAQSRPRVSRFLADFPALHAAVEKTNSQEEYLAVNWAIDNFVPLSADIPRPFHLLTYEQLVLDFRAEVSRLFAAWDLPVPDTIASSFDKPSSTTLPSGRSGIEGWQDYFDRSQIRRILRVVSDFGLDFYGHNPAPDLARMHSKELPSHLRDLGTRGKDPS